MTDQRTAEWYAARVGKLTASKLADAVAKTRSGYGASRLNYMTDLMIERLTGRPTPYFCNAAMQWGTDQEASARSLYEQITLDEVIEVGLVDHPTIPMTAASPDGLIADDGLVEIKCPNSATHALFVVDRKIPEKYIKQMQWQMECTGRQWCDFVSYDPRFHPDFDADNPLVPLFSKHTLVIERVDRDDELLDQLRDEVVTFLADLDDMVQSFREAA